MTSIEDFVVFCDACNAGFEPIRKGELCPRCDKVKAILRAEAAERKLATLEVTLDGLKVALAEMNAIALGE